MCQGSGNGVTLPHTLEVAKGKEADCLCATFLLCKAQTIEILFNESVDIGSVGCVVALVSLKVNLIHCY